jgi:hypothetical protein
MLSATLIDILSGPARAALRQINKNGRVTRGPELQKSLRNGGNYQTLANGYLGVQGMDRNGESDQQLRQKQAELRERVDAIRRDFKSGLDRDLEEQAVQLENAEVLDALLKQALTELEEIEQKLRRREK